MQTSTTTRLHEIQVTLDDGQAFPAWSAGDRWNGFAVPFFTRDVADRVAQATGLTFVDSSDAYVPEEDDYRGDDYRGAIFAGFNRDGMHLYGIGAYEWAWLDG